MRRSEIESDILKRIFIVFILTVALCISTSTATAAYYEEGTFTISMDKSKALSLWSGRGGILQIDVEVLTEYASIDVLLMDESNWRIYQRLLNETAGDEQLEYYEESQLNIKKVSFKFTAPKDGPLYVVLDNTFLPEEEGAAYVTFPVEVHVIVADVTHTPSISMVGVAIGLGIAFLAVTLKQRSRTK